MNSPDPVLVENIHAPHPNLRSTLCDLVLLVGFHVCVRTDEWVSLRVCSTLWYVTRRTLILSPLGTKNAGLHHSVVSLSLCFFSISSLIVLAALSSYLRASLLVDNVLNGK